VAARSASGRVQPAAGRPVAAGAVPVTAVPDLDGHARVLELLLLLEQPPAIRPAATTSAAPATADRRGPIVPASLLMARRPAVHVNLTLHLSATRVARPAWSAAGVESPTGQRGGLARADRAHGDVQLGGPL